jgi:hypothetical protein
MKSMPRGARRTTTSAFLTEKTVYASRCLSNHRFGG